jgi:hypothetical protein
MVTDTAPAGMVTDTAPAGMATGTAGAVDADAAITDVAAPPEEAETIGFERDA